MQHPNLVLFAYKFLMINIIIYICRKAGRFVTESALAPFTLKYKTADEKIIHNCKMGYCNDTGFFPNERFCYQKACSR